VAIVVYGRSGIHVGDCRIQCSGQGFYAQAFLFTLDQAGLIASSFSGKLSSSIAAK
jgi:hypothetical protein